MKMMELEMEELGDLGELEELQEIERYDQGFQDHPGLEHEGLEYQGPEHQQPEQHQRPDHQRLKDPHNQHHHHRRRRHKRIKNYQKFTGDSRFLFGGRMISAKGKPLAAVILGVVVVSGGLFFGFM